MYSWLTTIMQDISALEMNTQLSTFTPVRRRDYYTHAQKIEDDSSNWSTSRCNRLLRPLISRIAALQKSTTKLKLDTSFDTRELPNLLVSAEELLDKSESEDEWVPARKRARRTYSKTHVKRKGLNGRQSTKTTGLVHPAPGEYVLPTPVLLRHVSLQERTFLELSSETDSDRQTLPTIARGRPSVKDKRPNSRFMTLDGAAHFRLTEDFRAMKKSTDLDTYRAYEGIFHSLETILRATAPIRDTPKTGSKSLLSMCLRRVPEYIAEEEQVEKERRQGDGPVSAFEVDNISTEIYTELENFGASSNGWKHLRSVVRAHGIFYIKEAILKGLIDMKFSAILVDLCVHMRSQQEAESILSVLLEVNHPEPQSIQSNWPEGQSLSVLTTLDKFSVYTGLRPYQYRQLSRLFSTKLLPARWLATRIFGPLWTRAFQLVSYESYDHEASVFLRTVIPMLCEPTNDSELDSMLAHTDGNELSKASMATLTSVLVTLSAITVLRRRTSESENDNLDRFTRILRASISQLRNTPSQYSPERALTLILANIVSQTEASNLNKDFTTLLRTCASTRTTHHLSTFLVSTARCCRRASTQPGDPDYLELLHSILRDRFSCLAQDVRTLVAEILIDSATMMVKYDTKYSRYAKNLQAEFYDVRKDLDEDIDGEGESCFRWEEGISEWVTATPALPIKVKPCQQFEDSEDSEDCEDETPMRPRAVLPKKRSLLKRMHMTPSRPPPRKESNLVLERDDLSLSSPISHSSLQLKRKSGEMARPRSTLPRITESTEILETDGLAPSSPAQSTEKPKIGELSLDLEESDDELNSSGLTFDNSEDEMDTSGISIGSKRPFTLCTKVERRRRSGRVAGSEDELGF